MAMIQCHECDKDISDTANTCPHCGAPHAKPKKVSGCGALVLAGIVALFFIGKCSYDSPSTNARTASDAVEEAKQERALRQVATALASIKSANRNPNSVVWEDVRANDDASVICIQYRGQNGFGGMARDRTTLLNGTPVFKDEQWSKHCTGGNLKDMRHAQGMLK